MVKESGKNNFFRRRYVAPALAAVAGLSLTVAIACSGDITDTISPTTTPSTPTSGLESVVQEEIITYDMAKNDESLRQEYLNQVLMDRSKHGDKMWNAFANLIYDPEFDLLATEYGDKGLHDVANRLRAFADEDFIPLMGGLYTGENGVPLDIHVSRDAFEVTQSEDELFTVLDNESVNADLYFSGNIYLIELEEDLNLNSDYLFNLALEVLGYEKEFYNIEIGIRKVSPGFLRGVDAPAKSAYAELLQFSRLNNDDGKFAKAVIDAIESRPTLKYFK